jgi:murein DD-endopeptidase MepM/ murein hydrolase activator NlpD
MTVKRSLGRSAFAWRQWLRRGKKGTPVQKDVDEGTGDPWRRLSSQMQKPDSRTYVRDRQAAAWEAQWSAFGEAPSQSDAAKAPAWLYESSPYGTADDDGTLRQVDSAHWRPFRPRNKPASGRGVQVGTRTQAERGSVWLMQTALAVALLAVVVYGYHTSSALGSGIRAAASYALTNDWSQSALPVAKETLQKLRAGASSAQAAWGHVHTQPPLTGHITADYTQAHPEVVIQGTANDPVLAVAAGTVTAVRTAGGTVLVEIDHGASIGTARYQGLATVSVKQGEYVNEGEVIGRLPGGDHPALTFSLTQQNRAVNPHDFIDFPSDSP